MTKKNELANLSIPAVPMQTLLDFAKMTEDSATFLPRIQLITRGKFVDKGLIAPGHWGIPKVGGEEIEDLGDNIDILPLAARAKALDITDREAVVVSYDAGSTEFVKIRTSDTNLGCMWGPSFLVLLRNDGKLYEIFFSNASGRNEAPNLVPFLPAADSPPSVATLGSRYIERPPHSWHVPVTKRCSEPIANLPQKTILQDAIKTFMNPPKPENKKADVVTRAR
jgi:hypothetical protein